MKSGRAICFAGDLPLVAGCVTGLFACPLLSLASFLVLFSLLFPDTHLVVLLLLPSVWSMSCGEGYDCLILKLSIHVSIGYGLCHVSLFCVLFVIGFPQDRCIASLPGAGWFVPQEKKKKKALSLAIYMGVSLLSSPILSISIPSLPS